MFVEEDTRMIDIDCVGALRVFALLCLVACGPSMDENIEKLSGAPDERAQARHELILGSDTPVEQLIAALESQDGARRRAEVVAVLAAIMARSEDERIAGALQKHLLMDPEPSVRGRIAKELGVRLRPEHFDLFLQAMSDPSPLVQAPILLALGDKLNRLDDEQTEALRSFAGKSAEAEDRSVRDAAQFLVEEFVRLWAKEAQKAALGADLSVADSLYNVAVDYAPTSRQANYYLGTFYLENGERERGIQVLEETRLLIGIPRFASAPEIDGRLDEPIWQSAGRIDSFFTLSHSLATLLPRVKTRAFMGYTDSAFYWGARCFDAHPESLLIPRMEDKLDVPRGDRISFVFDRDLDKTIWASISVDTKGTVRDRWDNFSKGDRHDYTWDADGTAATFVGDDFWSVEFELRWDPIYHSVPVPGEISGIQFLRLFRDVEHSQAFLRYDRLRATGYILYQ